MRVTLIHNPNAGSAETRKKLCREFEKAGHDVTYQSIKEDDWKDVIDQDTDVIVAIGGDGTIRQVAVALAEASHEGAPLAIIPMGTANNVARTLGASGPEDRVAAELANARPARLAVGLVRVPGVHEVRFIESAGVGVFPRMLQKADLKEIDTMEEGLKLLHRTVEKTKPRFVHVEADGKDLSGEYIMVEAMNVRSIGARVALAPGADHEDHLLDLVLVGEGDRDALADYIKAHEEDVQAPFPVPVHKVRRIRMWWESGWGHVDDEPWPAENGKKGDPGEEVIIQVERHLPMLIP